MAGIAAEHLAGARSPAFGGQADLRSLKALLRETRPWMTEKLREEYIEVALFDAIHQLRQCEPVWRALTSAMLRGDS